MSIPISVNNSGVYQNPTTVQPQSTSNITENTSNKERPVRQDTVLIGKSETLPSNENTASNKQDAVLVNWTNQAASSIIKEDTTNKTNTGTNTNIPLTNPTTQNSTEQTQLDWSSLSNWVPSGSNLEENMKQLSNRYQLLWNFIDKNFSGESREELLFQLETLLSNKLQSAIQDFSQPLYSFLEKNGQQNLAQSLMLNIKDAVNSGLAQARKENQPTKVAQLWSEADKPNINSAKLKEFAAIASKDYPSIKLSNTKSVPQFSLADIQKATKFVNEVQTTLQSDSIAEQKNISSNQKTNLQQSHIKNTPSANNTNQSQPTAATVPNSKQTNTTRGSTGLDISLLPLKTEAFVKHVNLSPAMSNTIKAAVNTFLSNTLQTNNTSNLSRSISQSTDQPDRRLVMLVGERMAEEYRKSGNVDKSLQAGAELVKNVYESHPEKQTELSLKTEKAFTFWEIIYLVKEKKGNSFNGEEALEKLKNNWNGFVSSMELNKSAESAGLYWNYYNSGMAAGLIQKHQESKQDRHHFSLSSLFAASWFIVAILLIFIRFVGVQIPSLVLGINLILALIFGLSVSFKLSPKSKDSDNVSH